MSLTSSFIETATRRALAQSPAAVTLVIDGATYSGTWQNMKNARQYRDAGRVDNYSMTFAGVAADFGGVAPAGGTICTANGAEKKVIGAEIDPAGGMILIDLADVLAT